MPVPAMKDTKQPLPPADLEWYRFRLNRLRAGARCVMAMFPSDTPVRRRYAPRIISVARRQPSGRTAWTTSLPSRACS